MATCIPTISALAIRTTAPPNTTRSATPTRASSSTRCCRKSGRCYNLTKDPAARAIGGTSSGAICAFTVAWHRPDQFKNVISMIGSYTSIGYRPAQDGQPMVPGGDLYPTLIRKNPIKPIKIFLQDGSADLDNQHGSWFLANQQMLAAFNYANAPPTEEAAWPSLRGQARVG